MKAEDTKGVVRSRNVKKEETIQLPKEQGQ